MNINQVKPNLVVYAKASKNAGDSGGQKIGTVDHMEGANLIKLKKSDSDDGRHHFIPLNWVERMDENAIYLNKTADEFSNLNLKRTA